MVTSTDSNDLNLVNDGFVQFGNIGEDELAWIDGSNTNAPTPITEHSGIWSGSEFIIFGGAISLTINSNVGGRYDPSSDTWTSTSTFNSPSARKQHTAIWTDNEMIVWGGVNSNGTIMNYL